MDQTDICAYICRDTPALSRANTRTKEIYTWLYPQVSVLVYSYVHHSKHNVHFIRWHDGWYIHYAHMVVDPVNYELFCYFISYLFCYLIGGIILVSTEDTFTHPHNIFRPVFIKGSDGHQWHWLKIIVRIKIYLVTSSGELSTISIVRNGSLWSSVRFEKEVIFYSNNKRPRASLQPIIMHLKAHK